MSDICGLGHPLTADQFKCPQCGLGRLPAPRTVEPLSPPSSATTPPANKATTESPQAEVPPLPSIPPPAPLVTTPMPASPDGQWAWNGWQWVPARSPVPAATLSAPPMAESIPRPHGSIPARVWRQGVSGRAVLVLPVLLAVATIGALLLTGGQEDGSTPQPGVEKVAASKQEQCVEAALLVVEGSYDASGQTRYYRLSDNQEISREQFNALGNQYARFTTEVDGDARTKVDRGDALLHTLYDPRGRFSALPSPVTWIASKGLITSPATWANEMNAYCANLDRMFSGSRPNADPRLDNASYRNGHNYGVSHDFGLQERSESVTRELCLDASKVPANFPDGAPDGSQDWLDGCLSGSLGRSIAMKVGAPPTFEPLSDSEWNSLPHPGLDCTDIGLDNRTDVLDVSTHNIGSDSLTFVVRTCLVGTGSGVEVVEIYRGGLRSPTLVGTLLSRSDDATNVEFSIAGNNIRVTGAQPLPNDPNCCPSGRLLRTYAYSGGELRSVR